ncbi:MAG: hypothetical protein PHD33_04510, partial [Atribacterota bacterium]|nr:hypothetical protein [Atribacterota bacterium]
TRNLYTTTYVLDVFTNPNPDELVDRVEYWARYVTSIGTGFVKNRKVSPLLGKREFSVTFPVEKDVYDFSIYANDTFGNLARKKVNWSYLIFEDAIGFNTKTFTTKQENFYLNFTTPTAIIPVVYLEYNGTEYLSTRTGTSTNHQISNTLIPNTIGNLSFRWKITWGTNTVYTPYYTQTVQSVAFLNITSGNCAAGLTNVMNFVFKNEGNQTDLTGVNIKYNFEYGITGGTGAYSYGSINAVTKLALCINTSAAPTYDVGYGEIEYAKEGYTTRRYYIFDGTRLTNVTTNTTLYSLVNADSTSFLLEVRSPTLQPYVEIYASLLRWYPDLNEYKIVEMGNTDNKGQTVFKVKIEDVDYRVGIYNKNGSLIYIINPVRMVCLASPCSYTINVPVTTRDYLKETLNLESLIEYEDGMFTLTYNDPSQNTEMIRFVITQFTGVRDTVICETNGTSFTGILTCNVSGYEGTLKAVAYRTASPENPIALKIIQIGETVFQGTFGLFLQFLISIVLAFLGIINPVTAIILGLIAMVFGVMVIKTITYPILIAFSVLGGIIIYMMRRNT